jgi:glutamate N-acetyltransferase / amino-acid N-acetyltransferase
VSVTAPKGFVAAGVAAGIKASGDPDLSLVATADGRPVAAGGVFTSNKLRAAPVLVTLDHLAATGGRAAAVVLNSGNANAATGASGRAHAEAMCAGVAAGLGCRAEEVLVCSTGLIGIPLPVDVVTAGIPSLVAARAADGGTAAADAILTTDTVRKETVQEGDGWLVGGMAKGAAMLRPDMATMLAVLTTDADVAPEDLTRALRAGVATTFNRLSVDGAESTNDTVLLLASGAAGPPPDAAAFDASVEAACRDLCVQMARDAEGHTKVVTIVVSGAADDAEALVGARAIAESQLVKCSWYGEDPYWGRLGSELGSAGIAFDPDRLAVSYGGVRVAAAGVALAHDEAAAATVMAAPEIEIVCDLGLGSGRGEILTVDLTHAYVDENMGTS